MTKSVTEPNWNIVRRNIRRTCPDGRQRPLYKDVLAALDMALSAIDDHNRDRLRPIYEFHKMVPEGSRVRNLSDARTVLREASLLDEAAV